MGKKANGKVKRKIEKR